MKKPLLLIIVLLSFSLAGCTVLGENFSETTGTKSEKANDNKKDSEDLILDSNLNDSKDEETGKYQTNQNDKIVNNSETNSTQLPNQEVINPTDKPNQSQGITVNDISFSLISEENASEKVKQSIEKNLSKRGYTVFPNQDGSFILVIYAGEKSSGGYEIEVISIEDNEGITNILVKEIEPQQGDMVITVISYPYTIISFSGTTDNFKIVNTEGKLFEEIK